MYKYMYPAVFTPDEEEGGYTVSFPDLPGCVTEGDTAIEAFDNAKEALGGWLASSIQDNSNFPNASEIENIILENNERVMLIEVDTIYLREVLSKVVRINVTIPQWLNIAAKQKNISISSFLTKSLENELDHFNIAQTDDIHSFISNSDRR